MTFDEAASRAHSLERQADQLDGLLTKARNALLQKDASEALKCLERARDEYSGDFCEGGRLDQLIEAVKRKGRS